MGSLVTQLFSQTFDSDGNIAPLARMYWYEAGTSTPVTVYTDAGLSVAHSNPINADASGVFAAVYAPAGTYKIVVKESAAAGGATIYEVDNFEIIETTIAISFPTSVKTANFTVAAADRAKVFLCDASGAPGLNIIGTADSATLGSDFPFRVINTAATGSITVQGTGAQTINGAASYTLSGQYVGAEFTSLGAGGWAIIANSGGLYSAPATFTSTAEVQGTFTTSGKAVISKALVLSGIVTPSQIASDQNNYAPTGYSTATSMRLSTDASRTITGFSGGEAGKVMTFHNVGSFPLILAYESSSSTAANRFSFYKRLKPNQAVTMQYDGTTSRWSEFNFVDGVLEEITASAATDVQFDLTKYPNVKNFMVVGTAIVPGTDAVNLHLTSATDTVPTYETGASDYWQQCQGLVTASAVTLANAGAAFINVNSDNVNCTLGNAAGEYFNFVLKILDPANNSNRTCYLLETAYSSSAAGAVTHFGGSAGRRATQDTTWIKFAPSSGTISGTFQLRAMN